MKPSQWESFTKHSLVTGGLLYNILLKLRLISKEDPRFLKRSLVLSAVGWVPLCVLTLLDGTFTGSGVALPFLKDFIVHTRLLLVVPFLILAEKLVDPAYDNYINSTGLIVEGDHERQFQAIVARIDRVSNSWIPEGLLLALIYILNLLTWEQSSTDLSRWEFTRRGNSMNLSIAGLWFLIVSLPIYQMLLARWLWRWIIWAYSAVRFAALDLRLEASHSDEMAGLGYLNIVPLAFGVLSVALAAVFSSQIGESVAFEGAALKDFSYGVGFFVVLLPLAIFSPLLAYVPLLVKTKTREIYSFGGLVQYHNNLYREKWLEGRPPKGESILGAADNSSMADINGTYAMVTQMKVIPIRPWAVVEVGLLLLIPFIPLLGLAYSLTEIISMLAGIVAH
jgi:hypothetical protein